jgi:hypothetical protein
MPQHLVATAPHLDVDVWLLPPPVALHHCSREHGHVDASIRLACRGGSSRHSSNRLRYWQTGVTQRHWSTAILPHTSWRVVCGRLAIKASRVTGSACVQSHHNLRSKTSSWQLGCSTHHHHSTAISHHRLACATR